MILCSRCHERPKAEKHLWCLRCQADYRLQERARTRERLLTRGRHEGTEALRDRAVALFERLAAEQFTGSAVARIVRDLW